MAVLIERDVAAPVASTWAAVTDFAAHGRTIPFTRMRCDPGEPDVGWGFVGQTRIGPFVIEDPMRLTHWRPPTAGGPGRFAIVKEGRALRGWARVEVAPLAPTAAAAATAPRGWAPDSRERSRVRWEEEIRPGPALPRPLARFAGGPSDLATRLLFARALAAFARRAETGSS